MADRLAAQLVDLSWLSTELGKTRLNVVALGMPNSGKSSTLNSICKHATKHASDLFDKTKQSFEIKEVIISNISMLLVRTFGFAESSIPPSPILEDQLLKLAKTCGEGIHVFLIVFDTREFDEKQQSSLCAMVSHFGEGTLDHAIFVITGGETNDNSAQFERKRYSIRRFLRSRFGMSQIRDSAFILFNNIEQSKDQVRILMESIQESMQLYMRPYCPLLFKMILEEESERLALDLQDKKSEISNEFEQKLKIYALNAEKDAPKDQLVGPMRRQSAQDTKKLKVSKMPKLTEGDEIVE